MFGKRKHGSHDFELNLTPIIDCFVTLICFLLLSATYVNLTGLEAKVPVVVLTTSSAASKPQKPKFKLNLHASVKGLTLIALNAGSASGRRHLRLKDYAGLHAALVAIKRQRPKEFQINFTSSVDMPYENLVHYMSAARDLNPSDGQFLVKDDRNGKTVKIDSLFPDFVMAGLGAGKGGTR